MNKTKIEWTESKRGRHNNHATASKTGRWNKGKLMSAEGYVKIRVGKTHPFSDPNGYIYEHKLVIISAYGIEYIKGKIIHHINGDKTDNRLENLEVISRCSHNKHHNTERGRDKKGRFQSKKKAGNLLDGKVYNEYPKIKVNE